MRLRSTKCTIGAGEHCTLRIQARGVQPLHCVLIRKAARTIVRRWAKDTRLNGASFTDAHLRAGDRLSIGPIEFEVLESGVRSQGNLPQENAFSTTVSRGVGKRDSVVEHLEAAKDLARKRTEKMLARLREANRRIEELTGELEGSGTVGEHKGGHRGGDAELERERRTLESEWAQLREQQAELRRNESELEQRTRNVEKQQRTLEDEQRRWLDERREAEEWQQQASKEETLLLGREADLADRSRAVEEGERALAETQREFEDAQHCWEAERSARESKLELLEADLHHRESEIESRRSQLESERTQVESERAQVESERTQVELDRAQVESERTQVDFARGEIESGHSKLESERKSLEKIREELSARDEELAKREAGVNQDSRPGCGESDEIEALRADLEQQRDEMSRAREEVDSLREAIGKEREAVEADRERCEALAAEVEEQKIEAEQQSGIVAQEAAELRVEREAFTEEQKKWEAAQLDAQKQVEQRAEQLDRQKETLDAQKEELEDIRTNWEAVQAEAEAKLATRAEQLDEREHKLDERIAEFERTPQASQSGLDFFDDSDGDASPVKSASSSDLFRQLGGGLPSQTEPMSEFSELRKLMRDNEVAAEGANSDGPDQEPMIVMSEEAETPQRSVSEILLEDPVIADSFVAQPTEEPAPISQPTSHSPDEVDGEQSIEQYMAGLLARVNGESSMSPPAPVRQEQVSPGSSQLKVEGGITSGEGLAEERASEASSSSPSDPDTDESPEASVSGPWARAPEKAEDLVSLRELANLSAQSALDTHARSRLLRSVNAKLAVVAVALATAGVLFWRWFAVPSSVMHYYMGLAVILVAVLWGVQYAALAGYAYLTSSGRRTPNATEQHEPDTHTVSGATGFSAEPTIAEALDEETDDRGEPHEIS